MPLAALLLASLFAQAVPLPPVTHADLDRFVRYDRPRTWYALILLREQREYAEAQWRFDPPNRPFWERRIERLRALYAAWDAIDWVVIRREQDDDEGTMDWLERLRERIGVEWFDAGLMPAPWPED